jgi:hypothetical protein
MAKQMIEERIFTKVSYSGPVKFGEITVALEPDDVITQQYNEAYEGSVEAWEGHYQLDVHRMREETDAEYEKRRVENERFDARMKKQRYENYLKLKKEFENENQ